MTSTSPKKQSGSFILEALVSVLIFAVGLIALMGMSAQAIGQVGQTKYRNDASNLAGELTGQMWVAAGTLDAFDLTEWQALVADRLPNGTATVGITGTQVDIDISWADNKNNGVRHHYITSAMVAKN